MAGNNGANAYHRLPSFIKKFSEEDCMEELRIPPEFVASHGDDLPVDCRLMMPRGGRWPVRLLRIASGCHFYVGWPEFCLLNRIVDDDVLVFTMVEPGIFHVKRFKTRTGCPPVSDLEPVLDEDSDHSYATDAASTDDYQPSETEIQSSDDDDEEYAPDEGVVDTDGCPTFVVTLDQSSIRRTLEIPYAFWRRHIRMNALQEPVYFNADGETWRMTLDHSQTKIWVKKGWRRFKSGNNLVAGVRCHFKLIDLNEVQFYVWFDRP